MIKLDRLPQPKYLNSAGVLKENKKALDLFDRSKDNHGPTLDARKKFKFSKYNHKDVKQALIEMCNEKCAYCESTFLHVYFGDIEHFRPKKFIGTRKDKVEPGYYWLSNDWDNMFISCLHCNQAKKKYVFNGSRILTETQGKQNQFPFFITDKTLYKRRRSHKTWKRTGKKKDEEARALINPVDENPELYFNYTDKGIIVPSKKRGKKKTMAEESIRVYALQRLYLVEERHKMLIKLNAFIEDVKSTLIAINQFITNGAPTVVIKNMEAKYKNESKKLFHFTHKRSPFSAMCRQFVYEFFENSAKLKLNEIKTLEKKVHKACEGEWFRDFIRKSVR